MRLHPRHYVLIGLLILLGIWNLVRLRRAREMAAPSTPVAAGPGWSAFDQAADLRDAPEAQFTPALNRLRAQTESATGPLAADLRDCQMWLLYYRRGAPVASGQPNNWAMLATSHVQSCRTSHRDVGR